MASHLSVNKQIRDMREEDGLKKDVISRLISCLKAICLAFLIKNENLHGKKQ